MGVMFGTRLFRVFSMQRMCTRFISEPASTLQDSVVAIDSDKSPSSRNIIRLDFKDAMLGQAMLQVKSKKMRDRSGFILLEGKRLIQDYIDTGHSPEMIFFSRSRDLDSINLPKDNDTKLYKCSYKDLQLWSSVVTTPGVLAIARKPQLVVPAKDSLPVTVVCDQIREPGNLGSLIRISAGAGVQKLIFTKGCTDVWESKTLRAGTGAHFKVPLFDDVDWNDIHELVDNQPTTGVYLATNKPISSVPIKDYSTVDFTGRDILLVVGGETTGISKDAAYLASRVNGEAVSIALANKIESLNSVSAAVVLLFEIRKQYIWSKK